MYLSDLIDGCDKVLIESLSFDSRKQANNSIFFCIEGLNSDGHNYTKQAIEHGAKAIVYSKELNEYDENIIYIKVDDTLDALNEIARKFFKDPSKDMKMYAVTGTNGKTTIANIIQQISSNFGHSGYIGTLGVQYASVNRYFGLTTPDPIVLNEFLSDMRKHDVKNVAIEVSSHALAMKRVHSVDFEVAIFTNISRDHLDYHKTMENYVDAKTKLFSEFNAKNLLNIDDEYYAEFAKAAPQHDTYGFKEGATYQIKNVELGFDGTTFDILYDGQLLHVKTDLLCKYNVYNLTAAIAAMHISGYDLQQVIQYAENIKPISGRMNRVGQESDYNIYVDYAHTPDSFVQTFEFIRDINTKQQRVIVVFGSAGKRDKGKRSILGEIADRYTDYIILTEEDSRDEKTEDIASDISKGITTTPFEVYEYRYDAIKRAIDVAGKGDIILVLGKGQEKFLDRLHHKFEWMGDDVAVLDVLKEW